MATILFNILIVHTAFTTSATSVTNPYSFLPPTLLPFLPLSFLLLLSPILLIPLPVPHLHLDLIPFLSAYLRVSNRIKKRGWRKMYQTASLLGIPRVTFPSCGRWCRNQIAPLPGSYFSFFAHFLLPDAIFILSLHFLFSLPFVSLPFSFFAPWFHFCTFHPLIPPPPFFYSSFFSPSSYLFPPRPFFCYLLHVYFSVIIFIVSDMYPAYPSLAPSLLPFHLFHRFILCCLIKYFPLSFILSYFKSSLSFFLFFSSSSAFLSS